MSNPPRSRRTATKTADPAEQADLKKAREELSRMYERGEASPRPATSVRRSWERFDDLPEQGARRVVPPRAPVPRAEQNQRDARPGVPTAPPVPQPARELFEEPQQRARPAPLHQSRAALHEAEMLHSSGWSSLPQAPLYHETSGKPWLLGLIALASIAVILLFMMPSQRTVGEYRDPAPAEESAAAPPAVPAPNGEHSILRAPTLSAEQIDEVLREYDSPAAGTGRDWVGLGQKYGIDPAYALGFFVVESTAGTAQGWAGWKPDGSSTHNIGNIICAGYDTCFGRFRDYASWQEGIEDWYRLISVEYVGGRGLQTVEQIIPIYAPAFENDVDAYVNNVEGMVAEWRTK